MRHGEIVEGWELLATQQSQPKQLHATSLTKRQFKRLPPEQSNEEKTEIGKMEEENVRARQSKIRQRRHWRKCGSHNIN